MFINNNKAMKELAKQAFDYNGRKYKVISQSTYRLKNYWDGGSKEDCVLVNRETGLFHTPEYETQNPHTSLAHANFEIPVNHFIITHSIFMGKDAGITFYVRPEEMPKDLSSNDNLTFEQKVVLSCFSSFKSSYRKDEGLRIVSSQEWDSAKASLVEAGYISSKNSLTTKGKNAALEFSFYDLAEQKTR